MNLIDLLILDHARLRKDREEIDWALLKGADLRKKIKLYISDLELHETVEDKLLLSRLKAMPFNDKVANRIRDYESAHKKIWSSLARLLSLVDAGLKSAAPKKISGLRKEFNRFFVFVDDHVKREEKGLFPLAKKTLDPAFLEKSGRQAMRYYKHYSGRETTNWFEFNYEKVIALSQL